MFHGWTEYIRLQASMTVCRLEFGLSSIMYPTLRKGTEPGTQYRESMWRQRSGHLSRVSDTMSYTIALDVSLSESTSVHSTRRPRQSNKRLGRLGPWA